MNNKKSNIEIDIPCDKKIKCKILQIDESKYRTTLTSKFEKRKFYLPPNPDKIFTVLPGTVLDVFIKEGQKIKFGQAMITFEAMKMCNKIVSPKDGNIKSLTVKKGDIITKGQLIAELE
jgi:biotin carboxyl carrier protein